MPTHSCRSPPSQCGSCPKDWKDNPASCSTEPPASCAWLSLFRMHERMSCAGIVLRRFAGKDWLATVQRSSCSVSAANQTWGQKRANPNPTATRSAWSPANKWCLFASSLFVKTFGFLLVVPRPFPGVLVQLPAIRVLLPPIWQHLCANYC